MHRKIILLTIIISLSGNIFCTEQEDLYMLEKQAHEFADKGNWEKVKEILDQEGVDPECTDDGFSPLLHKAVASKNLDAVRLLIEQHNVQIDSCDQLDKTSLHRAVTSGFNSIALYLVARGASLDAKDVTGDTTLHYVIRGNNAQLFIGLLDRYVHNDQSRIENIKMFLALQNNEKKSVTHHIMNTPNNVAIRNYIVELSV